MEINKIPVVPEPLVQSNSAAKTTKKQAGTIKTAESFHDVLCRELVIAGKLRVSAHAQKRMKERNITIDQQDWEKINSALHKVEAKGAKNSLMIHEDLALIVSVTNRTVISAMDKKAMKEHVFTNIDSAVIVK
ncbi:TIGR02530 family flagellar biosynthesis protein [Desulfoscipio geothermicus]|uniref:Flagellar operon protein n=1 Tax=Desulfoscipio geothermicus DSM 3669 TaxID=1121426 RepID=A0A1I6CVB4_9FIRM|nr:TIGR02530 family flagellar biosynthesis protein [Desulfoscipio geothermicus]SFQ97053.1 flagellar operon protein [Desulfoscipio geothermicus DSM 3669]